MKYNAKAKVLEFSSDQGVHQFHDQLTEIMRFAMSNVGNDDMSRDEALKLSRDFFSRYSALSDALNCMREHLPRGEVA